MLHVDTQKIYSALVAGGFTEKQAETVIETMRLIDLSHLTTKQDLKEARSELRQEIKEARSELQQQTDQLRAEMKQQFTEVRGEIYLIKWMMGILLAGVLSLVMKTFFG